MKTKFALISILLILLTNSVKSQITTTPYVINNNKGCDVLIHWRIVRTIPNCPQLCNGNFITISASSFISIACAIPFGSAIEIVLLEIGGIPLVAPINFVNDIGPMGSCWGAGPLSCSGPVPAGAPPSCGPTWSMVYTGVSTTIF